MNIKIALSTFLYCMNFLCFSYEDLNKYVKNNGTLLRINKKKSDFIYNLTTIESPEKIRYIDFSKNDFTHFDFNAIKIFKNVEKLWLNNNTISRLIPLSSDTNLSRLKFINLMDNKLTEFVSDDFYGFNNLEELWLNNNQIAYIKSSLELLNLRELHLPKNQLREINLKDFQAFPYLYVLNLGYNLITTLADFQALLPHLEVLFLNNNHLIRIPHNALNNIYTLKVLYLQNNAIKTLETECFYGLQNLVQLFLQNNEIEVLPYGTFRDLQALYALYLRKNMISWVTPQTFIGLKKLKILDIADNRLSPNMLWLSLEPLKSLKVLYFHNNYIN